jgi:hypothetical protein
MREFVSEDDREDGGYSDADKRLTWPGNRPLRRR